MSAGTAYVIFMTVLFLFGLAVVLIVKFSRRKEEKKT